jgi:H+/Cl- antiporter ClcA
MSRSALVRGVRLAGLGAVSGAFAGVASFVFLELLDVVTDTRYRNEWLVWLLPIAGLVIGWTYHRVGGRALGGTALAVSEAHAYTRGAPARMAPLVLGGTLAGHLFGASVGREGTAVQMSSSLTDAGARVLRLDHDHRATLARAALAGGFGSVFGVPFAGVAFAMEVARRRMWRALVACIPAAFVGHAVVVGLGHDHAEFPRIVVPFAPPDVVLLAALGCCTGLVARCFARSVPAARRLAGRISWVPARPLVGGLATLALTLMVGADYLGLSLHLVDSAFEGVSRDWYDAPLKLLFTVIALGSGFVGGEVTPLFVIGATLGSFLADPLGLDPVHAAALGLVAVLGAAAHVPLACAVMAAELFGVDALVPALVVCVVARLVARGESIYAHPPTPRDAVEGPWRRPPGERTLRVHTGGGDHGRDPTTNSDPPDRRTARGTGRRRRSR